MAETFKFHLGNKEYKIKYDSRSDLYEKFDKFTKTIKIRNYIQYSHRQAMLNGEKKFQGFVSGKVAEWVDVSLSVVLKEKTPVLYRIPDKDRIKLLSTQSLSLMEENLKIAKKELKFKPFGCILNNQEALKVEIKGK